VDDATVAVRHLLAFAMLAGAIPSDLRTRRVPNSWWLPFAILAAVLLAADLLDPARDWIRLAIAYGTATAVAGLMYVFWRFRLFGGADAKALMVLAFLCPWPSPESGAAIAPAVDALANGSLLVLAIPLLALAVNLARGRWTFPAALLGRPMLLEIARAAHVWPMQTAGEDGKVRWRYWQKAGLADLDAEYDALSRAGLREVWVTAKVPFLVPLAGGLALAWWPGNLLALAAARMLA
jgi:archaeal preflagellin peptidase FlaK